MKGCLLTAALMGAAVPFARADMKLGQDRFFGHGTRGPYTLSMQGVEARSEQVRVNGRHMVPLQDYTFDAGMGALAFTEPVRPSDVVEVDYSYDTGTAHAPGPTGGTLGLLGGASGGLAFTYAFKPDASGGQQLSSMGFNGQTMLGGGTLTTNFMLDKTAKDGGKDARNLAMALKSDTGKFKYDLGYTQVGRNFSQADALKLVKGSEALNLTGSFQFASNGALSFKKINNLAPDAKKGDLATSLENATLDLGVSKDTHFTALHERQSSEQGKTATNSAVDRLQLDQKIGDNAAASLVQETVTKGQNGNEETVKATRLNANASGDHGLKVETALSTSDSSKSGNARDAAIKVAQGDGLTKVSLSLTDRRADAGDLQTHALGLESMMGGLKLSASLMGDKGSGGANETAGLGVQGGTSDKFKWGAGFNTFSGKNKSGTGRSLMLAAAPITGLSLNLSRSEELLSKGNTSSTRLGLDLLSFKRMKFNASYAGDDNGTKNTEATKLNLEANPMGDMKLVASHTDDHNDKGDLAATKVNLETTAAGFVKIASAYTNDDNGKVAKSTEALNIEAQPSDALKLTAALGGKSDDKGAGQSQAVGIEAKPGKALQFSASLAQSNDATGLASTRQASLALTPVKDRLSLSGSFSDQTKGNTELQIAVLQADVKPVDAIAVTGYYKQRDTGSPDQINTLNTQVTVKPADALQMVATYSANPEEKDQVLRLVRRGLSLQSHIGALSFSGGYLQEQSLLDESEGAKAEFTLGLKFNKHSLLQGGFQQTVGAVRGFKPMLAYNMKYTHNMGSDFNLLLDANVVQRDETVPADQRQEVKATANLGIRF